MSYNDISTQRLNNTLTHIINNQNTMFDILHQLTRNSLNSRSRTRPNNFRTQATTPSPPARTPFNENTTNTPRPATPTPETLFRDIEISLSEPINYHILNSIFNPSSDINAEEPPPISLDNLLDNTHLKLFNSSEEEETMCAICRLDIQQNEIVRKINSCGHIFHHNCLDNWLKTNHTCPICRCSLKTDSDINNESLV